MILAVVCSSGLPRAPLPPFWSLLSPTYLWTPLKRPWHKDFRRWSQGVAWRSSGAQEPRQRRANGGNIGYRKVAETRWRQQSHRSLEKSGARLIEQCSNLTPDPAEGRGRDATKSPGAFPAFHLLHISPGGAPKPPKMRAAATYFLRRDAEHLLYWEDIVKVKEKHDGMVAVEAVEKLRARGGHAGTWGGAGCSGAADTTVQFPRDEHCVEALAGRKADCKSRVFPESAPTP
ncbi:hypothetical protein GEV33_014900 [Tenebrio molitor]|uniref:Uncharacterized protein n=1 Tax=Tenebrio molitor TaxID=7067 RepID=A0A8J6LCA3_TENMO|nr:hypothetical protein GEV33_014900 [Tenebrio molitor]